MTIELDAVVERLAAEAAGGEGIEAYAELTTETSVTAFQGEVERLTSASSSGVGLRVVSDGRLGYAYTADLSDGGLRECLAEARANLEVSGEDPGNVLPEAAAYEALDGLFDTRLAEADPARKVTLALDLEARTRAADPKVTQVESARYGDVVGEVAVASSLGVKGSFAVTHAWCVSVALATEDGQSQVGYAVDTARSLEDLDPGPVAREAADRAVRMLGATKPPTRTVPVVFDRMVAPSLLGVLLAGLSAEEVQKRRSLFADRLGQRIGAAGLRLVDDGRLVAGPGAAPFDGEGVPTRRTVLIDDGVLACFLHNTATAARDGGGAGSTGNARRGSFKSTPGVSAHNLFLEPGDLDQAGLLARAGEGLLVQDVSGVHSGANPITGDFSVGVSGLLIRDGQLAEPVREATVAAHLLDILKGIDAVGSDLRFTTGSIGGSSLLIGEMTVAGAYMARLATRSWGDDGPLAVLVHGVTSSSRTWWRVGPALAGQGFRVVAVDLRGHGASPRTVAGLALADLADDVAETVDGPVELLVGHSLGALVSLELVGRRPGFARRLLLEDPPGSSSIDWAGLAAGIEADTRRATTDPGALRRDLQAANPAWPPGEAERRVADLADCDGQAVAAALRQGVPFDLPALLATATRLPTLMLLADEALGSNLNGLDRKTAVEALPAGATRVLPAGHSVHREALDPWLAAVDAWLAAP